MTADRSQRAPLPGKLTTDQARQSVRALAKGRPGCRDTIRTVAENKIREVV